MLLSSKECVAGSTKRCLKSFIAIMVACTLLSFFAVGCEKDKAKPDATVQTNVQQIYVHNPGEDVDDAIHANVDNVVKSIKENKIVEHVGAKVVGAYYNIESGEVSW